MTDRELLDQLRSDFVQLRNDVTGLQRDRTLIGQQIATIESVQKSQASWAIRVSRWIREHVGGHTNLATEGWTRGSKAACCDQAPDPVAG